MGAAEASGRDVEKEKGPMWKEYSGLLCGRCVRNKKGREGVIIATGMHLSRDSWKSGPKFETFYKIRWFTNTNIGEEKKIGNEAKLRAVKGLKILDEFHWLWAHPAVLALQAENWHQLDDEQWVDVPDKDRFMGSAVVYDLSEDPLPAKHAAWRSEYMAGRLPKEKAKLLNYNWKPWMHMRGGGAFLRKNYDGKPEISTEASNITKNPPVNAIFDELAKIENPKEREKRAAAMFIERWVPKVIERFYGTKLPKGTVFVDTWLPVSKAANARWYPLRWILERGDRLLKDYEKQGFDEDAEYEVDMIVDEREAKDAETGEAFTEYLIKYHGYELNPDDWQTAEGLEDAPGVVEYWANSGSVFLKKCCASAKKDISAEAGKRAAQAIKAARAAKMKANKAAKEALEAVEPKLPISKPCWMAAAMAKQSKAGKASAPMAAGAAAKAAKAAPKDARAAPKAAKAPPKGAPAAPEVEKGAKVQEVRTAANRGGRAPPARACAPREPRGVTSGTARARPEVVLGCARERAWDLWNGDYDAEGYPMKVRPVASNKRKADGGAGSSKAKRKA